MNSPDLAQRVLDCANKLAGTSFGLCPGEDIALEAFRFDSVSLFAFTIELESACVIAFDDTLADHKNFRTVRSIANFIGSTRLGSL